VDNFFEARLKHAGEKKLSMGGWWSDDDYKTNRKKPKNQKIFNLSGTVYVAHSYIILRGKIKVGE
jgi:hypothetical protein